MAGSKTTPKGGKPRKDGSTALPQLTDAKGRKYKDTPENRRKLGLAGSGAAAPSTPESTKPSGPGEAFAGNEDAVRKALAGGLTPGGPAGSPAAPGAPAAPVAAPPTINYGEVVTVLNMYLTAYKPEYAMRPEEEKAIGESLDAVIVKYFPNMKDMGPEFALALAVIGYAGRVFILPILQHNATPPAAPADPGRPS